jgi:diaminopimelate epimerase
VRFTKGHGTGNDFVVVADVDARLALTDADVAAITDRRFGIGADGILRVVPTAAVPEWAHLARDAPWFMDYRNADGSAVEMCGNGIRVFARYLHERGLVDSEETAIATRDGVKVVTRRGAGTFAVDMGRPVVTGDGHTAIEVDGTPYDVACVSMGNPHAILAVDDMATAPVHSLGARIERLPAFPDGTNVARGDRTPGRGARPRRHARRRLDRRRPGRHDRPGGARGGRRAPPAVVARRPLSDTQV